MFLEVGCSQTGLVCCSRATSREALLSHVHVGVEASGEGLICSVRSTLVGFLLPRLASGVAGNGELPPHLLQNSIWRQFVCLWGWLCVKTL